MIYARETAFINFFGYPFGLDDSNCSRSGFLLCSGGTVDGSGSKSILFPRCDSLGWYAGFYVQYLRTEQEKWDIAGLGAVEISLVFFMVAIILGSIWARPIWNTWWTWDPRLTTAAIVELIYAAYLLLRSGLDDPGKRARFSAIYAIFGFFSVPLTFISIRLLRTIHPVVIGSAEAASQGGFNMDAPMRTAFFFSLAAFSVFFADLLWHRIRLGKLQSKVNLLRIESYEKES